MASMPVFKHWRFVCVRSNQACLNFYFEKIAVAQIPKFPGFICSKLEVLNIGPLVQDTAKGFFQSK